MYTVLGVDQRQYGPAEADQIRQWIRERRLHAHSLVRVDQSAAWIPLSDLPEFQETLAGVPQAAPLGSLPAGPEADWAGPPRTNSMAVLGFILGLFSITLGCCCCYGFPFNILGIIFCAIALFQISQNPRRESGKALAVAGLVTCLLSFLLAALALVLGFASREGGIIRKFQP